MSGILTLTNSYAEKFWVVGKASGLAIKGQSLEQNGGEGPKN